MLALALMLVATGGCRSDQGPPECTLQMVVIADPDSVTVGGTVQLFASPLQMLPPGRSCGAATVTWSLSDSTLASVTATGGSSAVLSALRPGVLRVTARGTAAGHVDVESLEVTIY